MGIFIGHIGGFLILCAALMLFFIFLYEIGIIKSRNAILHNAKTATFTIIIGAAYYFLIAYFANISSGETNVFDFEKIFDFEPVKSTVSQCLDFNLQTSFSGLSMPLYPALVHLIGKAVFGQYLGTAVFINFISAAAGMCCLANTANVFYKSQKADIRIFAILLLPFAFLLFTPGYFGITFGFVTASCCAYCHNKKTLYLILGIFAVGMSKLGIFFLLPPLLSLLKSGSFLKRLSDIKMNIYLKYCAIFVLMLISSAVLLFTV